MLGHSKIVLTNGFDEAVLLTVENPDIPWQDHRRMGFRNLDEAYLFAGSIRQLTGWEIDDRVDSIQILDAALQKLAGLFRKMGLRP